MPDEGDVRSMALVRDCHLLDLPKINDPRGNLTFIEGRRHIAFDIRRAYWVYDVPGGETRGGHAYRDLHEFAVSLSGSFDFHVHDGAQERIFTLNRPYRGLYIPPMIWRHMENFSTNSVCLLLASEPYAEEQYLRDWTGFLNRRRGVGDNR
jgi:hypothetical protein